MNKKEYKSLFVQFNPNSNYHHEILIKQHKIREQSDDRPSDLTLFVRNLPPFCSESCLRSIFGPCGAIKSVLFAGFDTPSTVCHADEIKGIRVAYVVFKSVKSLEKALSLNSADRISVPETALPVLGFQKICQDYNDDEIDLDQTLKDIKQYLSKYFSEIGQKEKLEKATTEEDAEGWITVTKKGRNPGFARKKSVKKNFLKKLERKKRKKMLLNFYNFQIKESKMNHIAELRKKFELDKKKIEMLKNQRKFKPL